MLYPLHIVDIQFINSYLTIEETFMQVFICLCCDFKSCETHPEGCETCGEFCHIANTNDPVDFNHGLCDNCKEDDDAD